MHLVYSKGFLCQKQILCKYMIREKMVNIGLQSIVGNTTGSLLLSTMKQIFVACATCEPSTADKDNFHPFLSKTEFKKKKKVYQNIGNLVDLCFSKRLEMPLTWTHLSDFRGCGIVQILYASSQPDSHVLYVLRGVFLLSYSSLSDQVCSTSSTKMAKHKCEQLNIRIQL